MIFLQLGQFSSWTSIEAGVLQGSILGPLLLLIYIDNLSDDLITNVKLFADDASLFSRVHDLNTPARNLNNDLSKISDYNHFHKILRLFDVLPNFSYTASETMRNYYLQLWDIRVAS